MVNKPVNKVVLVYSGRLDTSVVLRWLQDTYQGEVVTFTAVIGQGEGRESGAVSVLSALVGLPAGGFGQGDQVFFRVVEYLHASVLQCGFSCIADG